jgi:ribosomal protein L11 methyltransferase
VMEHMLSIDFTGKQVLDMGCGTGILAILAVKMGAVSVMAVDNDANAVENTRVNCEINNTPLIQAVHGDATTPGDRVFDVILANINRNIILEDLPLYVNNLAKGGMLITSGYYLVDLEMIRAKAKLTGLSYSSHQTLDNWCRASFVKQ